jgi:UDP-N-acetylglucosamine 1-carboxyvinyltransferase
MDAGEAMGDVFVIEGGHPVRGTIEPAGNKNEALAVAAATLLAAGPSRITNAPRITDVMTMLEILAGLGVDVTGAGEGTARTLTLDAGSISQAPPDPELCSRIRGSFLVVPGLLHRTGRALVPRPGGDRIGRRRMDTHLLALRQLGCDVKTHEASYEMRLDGRFQGAEVFLDEASVMATENAVMAASVADGRTTILNAACEPHVQGLCHMLVAMGAQISGIGTNRLDVEGVSELHGAEHRIGPDHIEVGSFAAIAAMTRGELRITNVNPDDLRMIRLVFARLGVDLTLDGADLCVSADQALVIEDDVHGAIPRVDDAPWPGFPADLSPIALALATQARGTVLIHEKLFESRLFWVDRLIDMGARVVLCDPHRAIVSGPSPLHGRHLASPDIRAGMALVAAALTAEGESVIMNAHQVDRGYEDIAGRLRGIGAAIERV